MTFLDVTKINNFLSVLKFVARIEIFSTKGNDLVFLHFLSAT